jgi:hypothetical protein
MLVLNDVPYQRYWVALAPMPPPLPTNMMILEMRRRITYKSSESMYENKKTWYVRDEGYHLQKELDL